MKNYVFTKKSRINAPVEEVFKWHSRPGAIERLSPPWDPLRVISRQGGIETGAKVVLEIKAGPVPIKWVAEHTGYEENRYFKDEQRKGPFARWIHTHLFEPDGNDACFLEDHIEYAPLFSSGMITAPFIEKKLERIFNYRHEGLVQDLASHRERKDKKPLNIMISGASGLVGSALIPFFTTGGHKVSRLVRRPAENTNEIRWDPWAGKLNPSDMEGVDTVINLSGANIGEGRWTDKRKREIIDSRVKTTELLSKTIAGLKQPPKVMICASATGYYGDCGCEIATEDSQSGECFISDVCRQWEDAAAPAIDRGIRVVFLRIGITLSPLGGALYKMVPPFKLGLGGKFGSGEQYMSWITIDDLICSMYHVINDESLDGPVNLVSSNPVTNLEFTKTLGKVLSRPTPFALPETLLKTIFGQMGEEILVSGARVMPDKLMESGYNFRHPDLESGLRHLLGR
ncbi:TIGR01777 family oxidoreductase [Desulfobacterales bacterium HSG16]|nr:TIGR01777 family oxidoreductase [Desulfobacterales bacterium HSG16]